MMGAPADRKFANDCLRLWGRGQHVAGPKGLPNHSAFVLRARGVPIEWGNDLEDVVAAVVMHHCDAVERDIVRYYFHLRPDPRRNGELTQCKMVLTLALLKKNNIKTNGPAVDKVLSCVEGKVAMALSYPPAVWLEMEKQRAEMLNEKKVCNF
jgi:hypothetical protein